MTVRRDVPAVAQPTLPPAEPPRARDGQWVLELPFTAPLSLNDSHGKWIMRHIAVKPWRKAAGNLAQAAGIPACRAISVELFYTPRDDRPRDPLNLVAAVKAIEDGLVDAHVIPDDSNRYHTSVMPQITKKGPLRPGGNRLWVVVTAHPAKV